MLLRVDKFVVIIFQSNIYLYIFMTILRILIGYKLLLSTIMSPVNIEAIRAEYNYILAGINEMCGRVL